MIKIIQKQESNWAPFLLTVDSAKYLLSGIGRTTDFSDSENIKIMLPMCDRFTMLLPMPLLVVCPESSLNPPQLKQVLQDLGYQSDMLVYAFDQHQTTTMIIEHVPNLVLYVIRNHNDLSHLSAIRSKNPHSHLIAAFTIDSTKLILASLQCGIDSYILLTDTKEKISESLKIALRGGAYLDASMANCLISKIEQQHIRLNENEQTLIGFISQDRKLDEIQTAMGLSGYQIYASIKLIYRKLRIF